MTVDAPVVIVGASLAGIAGAEELRRRGFDGEIVLIGDEKHHPYDRPPLSKGVPSESAHDHRLRSPGWEQDHRVDLRLGTPATGLDIERRIVRLGAKETVAYGALVIATGASARVPTGWEMAGVLSLRTFEDSVAIWTAVRQSSHVVVIGGGFNGAEVAAAARRLGAKVTLVANGNPLERVLGPTIGQVCAEVHRDEGVCLRLGVPAVAVEGGERVERVRLADGSTIEADVVVVGYGVTPNTEWLADSGVVIDDGVVCDAFCRTSASRVVAAGDVARWDHLWYGSTRIEHWENAVSQGCAAVGSLLDSDSAPYVPVPYAWSDQFDHTLQVIGRPRPTDAVRVIDGSINERRFAVAYSRGDRVVGGLSFNRPSITRKLRKALHESAGAVSPDALNFTAAAV